jgi:methylenetetrahydrofolate dehydrogenase (NADP+) / methenyltetrahydrofolate cyclohydrolase
MSAKELGGRPVAQVIRDQLTTQVADLTAKGTVPTLALVVATNDEAANSYIQLIVKTAATAGITTRMVELGESASEALIAEELNKLAQDSSVHGIILQTPLPTNVDGDKLRPLIPAEKDVDGANPLSAGRLFCNIDSYVPATAAAVMAVLNAYNIPLSGAHVVVVGRSRVVGKPLAHLLLNKDSTVTLCHSKTQNLAQITKQADVLVAAVGRAGLITAEHVKPGAIVIDVGTNISSEGGLVGDVEAATVREVAGGLSPVPGGVGPVTTAILLKQTVAAAQAGASK